MEVRDERVRCTESVAWVDKYSGLSRVRADDPAFVRDAFEHAAGRCPDGYDPSAIGAA